MARGLREGDEGNHLITFHPTGGHGSAEYFHNEAWLDFNMRQNGHEVNFAKYSNTGTDYNLKPLKPIIDGEPIYEDHPVSFDAKGLGHSISSDVRRPLYWDLFSGAFGHTYGHHSVWQMWQPGRDPINDPLMPWYEAIYQPGSGQMQYGRRLIESRPFLSRIPDNSIIVDDSVRTAVPGRGRYRMVATRDTEGTYAMVYTPVGRSFSVHMDKRSRASKPRLGGSILDREIQLRLVFFPARESVDLLPRLRVNFSIGFWFWMTPPGTTPLRVQSDSGEK